MLTATVKLVPQTCKLSAIAGPSLLRVKLAVIAQHENIPEQLSKRNQSENDTADEHKM